MMKSDPALLNILREKLDLREERILSPFSTGSRDAVRQREETSVESGYRQAFSLDTDRIMHSLAYTRYIDKTQVFYLTDNDHITHRVLHVQLVSKIARTIGRFLRLNEDLIEAVALGHDIGHTPFGHDGERFLTELCLENGIGSFYHSVQSVHFLEKVERKGKGCNLSLQTLDGILCHDGEADDGSLSPDREKGFPDLARQIEEKKSDPGIRIFPMTLEGCVVRIADTIAYIGRDLEDAIRLDLIRRSDLPEKCTACLGNTNGTIVYTLVTDVIKNSMEKDRVVFSEEVFEALRSLKAFNLERIYLNPKIKGQTGSIREIFRYLFEKYLEDLREDRQNSMIYSGFLADMDPVYRETQSPEEIVRDFIAGMTDRYFIRQAPDNLRPCRENEK